MQAPCPMCGTASRVSKSTTREGWLLFIVGLLLLPFGIGIIPLVIAMFKTERRGKCVKCKAHFPV